jgi:3-phenylpropionate/cinnamic acid dioxygenase small subunit
MDDYREIENLIYRYALALDGDNWDSFGELFADAELVLTPAGSDEQLVIRGEEAVNRQRANCRLYSDGTPLTSHVTSNVLIDIDEDGLGASASSYNTCLQNVPAETPGAPLHVIFCGRYLDRFAKDNGRWRFVRRQIVGVSIGDMSAHVIGFDEEQHWPSDRARRASEPAAR